MAAGRSDGAALQITVTGDDEPGVTGLLFAALEPYAADVLDVEQVVIGGALTLGVVIATDAGADAVRADVSRAVGARGLSAVVTPADSAPEHRGRAVTHAVVVLARPLAARAIALLAQRFAAAGINIETIRRVAHYPVTGVELGVRAGCDDTLRAAAAEVAADASVDIAVDRAGLARRAKRLVVFDVDSTLITGEVIEMLAEYVGQRPAIEQVTAAAMRGELDFEQSLRQRVAVLAGLDVRILDEVGRHLPLTPGARTTVRTLHRLGYRCGIVSGGFTQITRHLVDDLGLDFAAANTLEVVDGTLTGRLVGPIVDRAGKAAALRRFATEAAVPLAQTVAIGDGANDIDMLTTAGLGIAFNAKPIVAEHADTALNQPFLDPVLFMLGITRDEVDAADAADARAADTRPTADAYPADARETAP